MSKFDDVDYGKIVATKEFKSSVSVRKYDDRYDWIHSSGEDSDELFTSITEAFEDAKGRFGD